MHDTKPGSRLALATLEPMTFGHGFISGMASALLGLSALGVVLALRFPDWLSLGDLAPVYGSPYLRAALHVVLVLAFVLGSVSAWLRSNKMLALVGLGATLAASLLGGSQVAAPMAGTATPSSLAVDFFVLNLLLYSAVFVPLERMFALRGDQLVFRRDWRLDLSYFFFNSLLVEVLTVSTLTPALVLFDWARVEWVATRVAQLPVVLQLVGIVLVADFTQYWVHRAFHAVPLLWPFHAIHHSSESMDWLAGSRLHLVDVLLTRGLTYVPIFVLGFSQEALIVYVVVVASQATFIHANVRWRLRPLRRLIATPAFHHWHHSAETEALDRNFAVHTPVWDLLFGTYYLPERWPAKYGVHGRPVPTGWWRQLVAPFTRSHHE